MNSIDLALLRLFNSLAGKSPALDSLIAGLSNYAPLLVALLLLVYFVSRREDSLLMRKSVLLAGLSGALALAVSVLISSFIYRARPFVVSPEQVHLLLPHAADSSFPSDHAIGSAAFAVGMWHAPGRSAAWIFTVLAVLVACSRLAAGVHWPSDVLASLLLGGLVAQLVWALRRPLDPILRWVLGIYGALEQRLLSPRR